MTLSTKLHLVKSTLLPKFNNFLSGKIRTGGNFTGPTITRPFSLVRSLNSSSSEATLPVDVDDSPDPTRPLIHTYQGHKLVQFNRNLERVNTPEEAYKIGFKIKENQLKPDCHTYNVLLKAIRPTRDFNLGLTYLKDMLAMGVYPDISTVNLLLELGSRNSVYVDYIIKLAESLEIGLNASSREIILHGLYHREDYQQLLATWETWRRDPNLAETITLPSYQILVKAYAELGMSETALQLLQNRSHRAISSTTPVWLLDILRIFSSRRQADESYYLLSRIIDTKVIPDEGTCEALLVTAAQTGHIKLANLVVQVLGSLKVELTESHFIPLIITYLKGEEKDWKRLIYILDVMKEANLPITTRTFFPPTLDYLCQYPSHGFKIEEYLLSIRCPHESLWKLLFAFHVRKGQLEHAMELYHFINTDGVPPIISLMTVTTELYDLLLEGAAQRHLPDFGHQLVSDLESRDLPYTITTYSHLISLALTDPDDYEPAFVLLEKMKSEGHLPPVGIYKSIVRRLAIARDPRVYLAMDEMRSFSYVVTPGMRRMVETGGTTLDPHPQQATQDSP